MATKRTQKQLLEKFEKDAAYAESKAREYAGRATALREKIARMKREAAELIQ